MSKDSDDASDPTDRSETQGTASVTVESTELQYGFVELQTDAITLRNPRQPYLVVSVHCEDTVEQDAFALGIEDRFYTPVTPQRVYRIYKSDQWYTTDQDTGLLLFEPTGTTSSPITLRWDDGKTTLPESLSERLNGSVPQFSATLDVPATHDSANAPPITITVTNEGERDRRFLGALNRVGPRIAYIPAARLSRMVPAGETVELSIVDSWRGPPAEEQIGDGDPDVTYHLNYGESRRSKKIRLTDTD